MPWYLVATTPVQLLQFTMRLLTFVALFTMIGLILYLDQRNWRDTLITTFTAIFIVLIAMTGVTKVHSMTLQNFNHVKAQVGTKVLAIKDLHQRSLILKHLTPKSYQDNVNWKDIPDYHLKREDFKPQSPITAQDLVTGGPANAKNKATVAFNVDQAKKFKRVNVTDQQVVFKINQAKTRSTLLPVVGYHNIQYHVLIDGRTVTYKRSAGQLMALIPKGAHQVTISVANNSRRGGLLLVSVIVFLVVLVINGVKLFRSIDPNRRTQKN
ncbi:hypothetical protein GTO98_07970 [Lactiplantibacillus plantarum]|nr:hypothetical protein [Lactiplantibacillus plantarum]MBO2707229.1 hypothetical protein [Lactiplantibacillus plantarum]